MTLFQADLAREIQTSEMSIHRALKAMHRTGKPLTDLDAIAVLAVAELQSLKLTGTMAARLLSEMWSELRFVTGSPENRCWIVFVENDRHSFRLTAMTTRHLQNLLESHPLSLVLPLHEIAARASDRLETLKAKKEKTDA